MLERILELMKRRGIKASELAERLNVNRSIVSTWKNGKTRSYLGYLPQIADILGVSVDDLYPLDEALLTNDEAELLRLYRNLPEKKQGIVLGRMLEMLEDVVPETVSETKKEKTPSSSDERAI